MSRSGIYHAALYEIGGDGGAAPAPPQPQAGQLLVLQQLGFQHARHAFEHAVRSSIFDAFEREIARPIGMQDYRPSDGEYVTGAASAHPGYHPR